MKWWALKDYGLSWAVAVSKGQQIPLYKACWTRWCGHLQSVEQVACEPGSLRQGNAWVTPGSGTERGGQLIDHLYHISSCKLQVHCSSCGWTCLCGPPVHPDHRHGVHVDPKIPIPVVVMRSDRESTKKTKWKQVVLSTEGNRKPGFRFFEEGGKSRQQFL